MASGFYGCSTEYRRHPHRVQCFVYPVSSSSAVRSISEAPAFSCNRLNLRVPGIGTIHAFLQSIHARDICAGVAFFLRPNGVPVRATPGSPQNFRDGTAAWKHGNPFRPRNEMKPCIGRITGRWQAERTGRTRYPILRAREKAIRSAVPSWSNGFPRR